MRWCGAVLALLVAAATARCPDRCDCGGARLSCRGAGLREIPSLPADLLVLDVAGNNISTLHRASLETARALRDLDLSDNRLEAVSGGAFSSLPELRRLALSRCGLRRVPGHALRPLAALHHLWLDGNRLEDLDAAAFAPLRALRSLRLDHNRLRRVPGDALRHLPRLQMLDLTGNLISELEEDALPSMLALQTLVLRDNLIAHVDERAFAAAPALRSLRLEDNLLTELPTAVGRLPRLEDLWLIGNRIDVVEEGALRGCRRLVRLELRDNPLQRLHACALHNLTALHTLSVSGAKLRTLPSLMGCTALRTLRADRARLHRLSPDVCLHAPSLRTLDVKSNQLSGVPDLSECGELRVLELSWNRIASLEGRPLRGLRRLHDLLLAHNELRALPRDAFLDTPSLQLLDLEGNQIEHIDGETFVAVSGLEDLNVGANQFAWLPAGGLQRLRHLKAHNNPRLRTFHPPEVFPRIETLVLSYAYHCCEFMPMTEEEDVARSAEGAFSDFVVVANGADPVAWANATDLWHHYVNASWWDASQLRNALTWETRPDSIGKTRGRVQCAPRPGPFLPCVDLFDWWTLRCGVWAVFLLALLGNGTVVLVLALSRSRMDVPRFLVANLAAADLCMGLYLGFLAVVDAGTLGEFRAHAVAWQLSAACRLAGFLAVLSSELSVYTLAVITLERNYAITHAMHLNKRLSLRHAAAVMGGGWAFALAAAALPLAGVSDYRKFAVCLPFETGSPMALGYVTLLLAVNGLAFVVLLGCYLRMYCAIRGSQAWNSNDSRIAKRMALLVFTDFLCWAPVAAGALSAVFGARLVSLEQAKVLTVFVLPLNSCCNPFLYAILTKQFKKDCALVCKQIEESRVTRGIGRCRHSSNFSNRQTPANTDSLVERSSRAHRPSCACRRLLPPPPPPIAPPRPPVLRRARDRLLRYVGACTCSGAARVAGGGAGRVPGGGGRAAGAGGGTGRRAGSMSSSVEFSSSRSDSWRACAGRPPPPRRAASWLVARKTSQDSNLSSSRNDSSGSNATASTGTWRTSRSGGSAAGGAGTRPRLTRQPAVLGEEPPSPAREGARLHTIPSAAEPDAPLDEAPTPR